MGLGKPGWTQRTFTRPRSAELGAPSRSPALFLGQSDLCQPSCPDKYLSMHPPGGRGGRSYLWDRSFFPSVQVSPFSQWELITCRTAGKGWRGSAATRKHLPPAVVPEFGSREAPWLQGNVIICLLERPLVCLEMIVQTTQGKSTPWNVTSLGYYLHHFWVKVKDTLLEKLKLNFVYSKTWEGTRKVQNLLASIWLHFRLLYIYFFGNALRLFICILIY